MSTQSTAQHGLLSSLGEAWSRYRRRRAAIAELRALGHQELEHVVHDVGLTMSELNDLAPRPNDSAEFLYRRLDQTGIDDKSVDALVMRDMQRCCSLCDQKARCEKDLAAPKAATWPEYCPNEQTIEALRLMKHH